LTKALLIYTVRFHISVCGGLEALFGGISPTKLPRSDGTG